MYVINKGLSNVDLKPEYNTDDDNIIQDLYGPCFKVSREYDRAVGYFRSNIYRELGEELLNFVIKGGKVRIVCSPYIPELDEKYAREGYVLRGKRNELEKKITIIKILESMSNNPKELDCLEMLRVLIEKESLDLYIAIRSGGIYHRKIGRFVDENGDKVVFSGSGNETIPGVGAIEDWSNDEDFDVYRSWGEEFERRKLMVKERHLDDLFQGKSGRTLVRRLNDIEKDYLKKHRKYKTLEECRSGAKERSNLYKKRRKTDFKLTPYIYQKQAIDAWKDANYIGMISMPTGVGKTYAALFGIEELLLKGHPILIVVPSSILLNQWKKEIAIIYPDIPVLLAGAGNNWRNNPLKRMYISDISKPRIILSTMATASSDDFLTFVKQTKKLILIADEAHRLGSPVYQKIMNITFFAKMGLSATPMRLYDDEGNAFLRKTFGDKPVYNLSLGATVTISEGNEVPILGHFLSKYNYHFYSVDLTYEEKVDYEEYSEQIRKVFAITESTKDTSMKNQYNKRLNMLLIQRARIAKKAFNKAQIVSSIISETYSQEGRWIVYCEDEAQLNTITLMLRERFPGTVILKYHSKMKPDEKSRSLTFFEENPGIIVSIRCLDEGVDIPQADGAIIVASSTNPRQYIQRRGRVLRKAIGKKEATIIDVLVIPSNENFDITSSLIKNELARAWSFSKNATNQDVTHELWKLCRLYDIDLKENVQIGYEEDEV